MFHHVGSLKVTVINIYYNLSVALPLEDEKAIEKLRLWCLALIVSSYCLMAFFSEIPSGLGLFVECFTLNSITSKARFSWKHIKIDEVNWIERRMISHHVISPTNDTAVCVLLFQIWQMYWPESNTTCFSTALTRQLIEPLSRQLESTHAALDRRVKPPRDKDEMRSASLTLISSSSIMLRAWLLRFQTIGGRWSPVMAHVSTALWPTVTVVILNFWSSGRLSW